MARGVAADVIPRRLRAGEQMQGNVDAGVTIHAAQREAMNLTVQDAAQGRTADLAEGQAPAACAAVSGEQLGTALPGQRTSVGQGRVSRRGTAKGLSASRAMAGLRWLQLTVQLIADCAAKTSAFKHRFA